MGNLKYTHLVMLILGIFSICMISMNLFYLPSLGVLSLSKATKPEVALKEFKAAPSSLTKRSRADLKARRKNEALITKKNQDRTDKAKNNNISSNNDGNKKRQTKEEKPAREKKVPPPADNAAAAVVSKEDENALPFTMHPRVAGLKCEKYGGPSEEIAAEMVYWRDIPSDASFVSPYKTTGGERKYLTFEPDEGGFNNIRMSMETATATAHAMGRTLVLPPEQNMYLLGKDHRKENNRFTFKKFFPFDAISEEHVAVDVITMEEFLHTEVMGGNLKDANGTALYPPGKKTNWEGHTRDGRKLWHWLRSAGLASTWDFSKCTGAFPAKPGPEGVADLKQRFDAMDMSYQNGERFRHYNGNPTPVNGTVEDRLSEMLSFRKEICIYNETMQDAKVVHFMGDNDSGARLLVHFYAFLFFQDWKQDLWTKRYVRDHLRYIDEIQCAAATIVNAVRTKAREHGNPNGEYDSMHIRRGDFQYKQTRIDATKIYKNIASVLTENATLFVATDERDKKFFDPLREHYHLYFLDDFLHLLPESFNKNYYGMLDQRIASRGRVFAGAYFSTFTGYINRMRGYHSQKNKLPGYQGGNLKSHFYVPLDRKNEIATYSSLRGPLWGREFPVSWRDIDHDLEDHHIVA